MQKRMYGKRAAAWILSAAMVFGNSSFTVLAGEQETEPAAAAEVQTVSETEAVPDEMPVEEETSVNDSFAEETSDSEEEDLTENEREDETPGSEEELFDEEELIIGNTYENEMMESTELLSMAVTSGGEEEETGPSVDLEWRDYGRDTFTWIYEGTKKTIYLNKEGLGGLADYTVEWSVVDRDMENGEETADPSELVEVVSSDAASITLKANEGCEEGMASVFAFIKDAEGNRVAGAGMDILTMKAVEEYSYPASGPGENRMLVDGVIGLGSTVHYYVEDADHPYGEEGELAISDVVVKSQYTWDENGEDVEADGIVRPQQDGRGNWMICGDDYGWAEVAIVHQAYDSEKTVEYSFEVYVNGDSWELCLDYPDYSDQMLTGSEMEIYTSLYHEWRYGDDQGNETVEDYTLQIDPAFQSDAITVKVDGTTLVVTSTGGETWENVPVSAIVTDEEGKEIARCDRYFSVSVSDGYYIITPYYAEENVPLNGTLDLNQAEFQVWQYSKDSERKTLVADEKVEFRLTGYDREAWSVEAGTGEEPIPVLVREGDWDTDITVKAGYFDEEENWVELASRDYHYDGLDYSVWFEEGVEEPKNNHTWVFEGDIRELALNTENLQDKGEDVSIWWSVYQGHDEAQGGYYGEIRQGLTVSKEDPGRVTLDYAALADGAEKDENGHANDVVVVARVMLGEGDDARELSCTDVWVTLREAEREYRWTKADNILKDDSIWVGNCDTQCWVKDASRPDGEDVNVTITYELDGESYADDNVKIYVSGDNWYVEWDYPEGTDQMNPGDTMTLDNFVLRHDYINWEDNENHVYGEEAEYTTLKAESDELDEEGNPRPNYDPELINVAVTEGGRGLQITANDGEYCGDTNIWVRVMMPETDEDGNPVTDEQGNPALYEQCGTSVHINVTEEHIHRMTHHEAVAATCTEEGTIEYYSCDACGKNFRDEEGTEELTSVTVSPAGHHMTHHPAVAATCSKAGNVEYYSCGRCRKNFRDVRGTAQITGSVTIPVLAHRWSAWTTVSKATVFAPEKQIRTCKVTNHSETRNYGSKVKPTMKLTADSLVMKVKQSTTRFAVSGMAAGDYLASVTSSNTALLKVSFVNKNGTFKLTAQKKTGTANLTFKLASGLTKTIKVKIQKGNVKSTGITGVAKTLTVQQGKTVTLSPVIAPVTSHDKVKYSTSNKKVATVSSKGVVKGVKGGTAKITIKAGAKKFVCTVKVEGVKTTRLTNVKSSITLKKKKSYTLKPKGVPAASTDEIKYTSSNKKVATVSSKGKITAKGAGTAVITVKCGSAVSTCTVTVK